MLQRLSHSYNTHSTMSHVERFLIGILITLEALIIRQSVIAPTSTAQAIMAIFAVLVAVAVIAIVTISSERIKQNSKNNTKSTSNGKSDFRRSHS